MPHTEGAGRHAQCLPVLTYLLGLDVHKNTITAGVLEPGSDVAGRRHDLLGRGLGAPPGRPVRQPRRLRACYEAGPTGYELARLLRVAGGALRGDRPVVDPDRPG